MIVSWNWLTDYLRLDMPVETLTERLALRGLNHEETREVGGDLAIDLEVTSNRPDCLSHIGIARETAVVFGKHAWFPEPDPQVVGEDVHELARVDVEDPDLCPRFTARVITGVKVGASPWSLRKRLETLGLRSINNIADITNYVLFECGQPLHAYDYDKLVEHRLIVRKARPGESLIAINNKKYDLTTDMLVIADAARPVGLAGVMGGLDTEISESTKNVLIESARFDPVSIRRTGRALGLSSDSSFRFERGLDPERTEWASRRCAQMIVELAGGTLHPGVVDIGSPAQPHPPVVLRYGRIEKILGIAVERDRARAILEALGLDVVAETSESVVVKPPSWRADLEREIDLIEEIARIHGYEQIPEDRSVPTALAPRGKRERVEDVVRSTLTALGYDEAVTFSLVSDELSFPIFPIESNDRPPLKVEHSTRKKETILRRDLVPSLLAARRHNEARGEPDAHLFEIAQVYHPKAESPLPDEPTRLAIVGGGDFRALKGVVETVLERLHIHDQLETELVNNVDAFEPSTLARISLGGSTIGYIGSINHVHRDALELRQACYAVELSFDVLIDKADLVPRHARISDFPAVSRDLSLVLPNTVVWKELSSVVLEVMKNDPTFEDLTYLDSFSGGNVQAGFESVHFGLRFRGGDRTLTGEEVDRSVAAIVEACRQKLKSTLRT
jgi:phenylalanyl-tRNA synthetase beta chain